jgi:pimeloyl-ACP methyl ester carboxylesterase
MSLMLMLMQLSKPAMFARFAPFVVLLFTPLAITLDVNFDWDTIEPSRELRYSPCYESFKCARLLLPLDWLDPVEEQTVAIAIISLPAAVPESDPSFGGTVITNPGGPGGSGVRDVVFHGHQTQSILDGKKRYEVLSFDPRGVFYSTPHADCFDNEFERGVSFLEQRGIGGLDGGSEALKRHFARAKAFGSMCANATSGGPGIRAFMSTASVARDMVEIVDRVDELRRKGLGNLQLTSQKPLRLAKDEIPRIQYLGFSYGTFLGNTFASMFPDRVGRMILDGVEDPYDYLRTVSRTTLLTASSR